MKRFLLKQTIQFRYSYFIYRKVKKLTKKKWMIYKRFNFRNYLTQKFFNCVDLIKMNKKFSNSLKRIFKDRLTNKQWMKHLYGGFKNKQFKSFFLKNRPVFVSMESRLDVAIFRSNLTANILTVRNLIGHGKIKVNNKSVTQSNFILKQGDIVFLKSNCCEKIINPTPMNFELSCELKSFIFLSVLDVTSNGFFLFKELHFHKIYSYFISQKN